MITGGLRPLQREAESATAARSESTTEPPAEQFVYRVVIDGQEVVFPREELTPRLHQVALDLQGGSLGRARTVFEWVHNAYNGDVDLFRDQPVVGGVLLLLTGARHPHDEVLEAATALNNATAAVATLADETSIEALEDALRSLALAEERIAAAEAAVKEYRSQLEVGGDKTVRALEITRDWSFVIAGAYFSMTLLPAATTLGGAMATGAAGAVATTGTKEAFGLMGRAFAGTTGDFASEVGNFFTEIAIAGVVGAIVGGSVFKLKPAFASAIGERIMARWPTMPSQEIAMTVEYLIKILANLEGKAYARRLLEKIQAEEEVTLEDLADSVLDHALTTGLVVAEAERIVPQPSTPEDSGDPSAVGAETYAVQPGDTLWAIAASRLGPSATSAEINATWRRYYTTNRQTIGADPDRIRPGMRLILS